MAEDTTVTRGTAFNLGEASLEGGVLYGCCPGPAAADSRALRIGVSLGQRNDE